MTTSIYKGIQEARASFSSNYERAGNYLELILQVKEGTTRPPKNTPFVVFNKTVLRDFGSEPNHKGQPPHRPGEEVSDMLMSDKDAFLPNLKSIYAVLLDEDPDSITEAMCAKFVSEDQPFSGLIVECQSVDKTSRADKIYTLTSYRRLVSAEEAETLVDPILWERISGQVKTG